MFSYANMINRPLVYLCAICALAALGLAPPQTDPADLPSITAPDKADLIVGQVIRILDADTLLIKVADQTRRYQLLGADAPEITPRARIQSPVAIAAAGFIEQMLLNEPVYIQHDPTGERDSANRYAGYIFRAPDMLLVNLELIRQGYAKYNPLHGTLYNDTLSFYESRSKELNKLIWNPKATELVFSDQSPQLITQESTTNTPEPEQTNQQDSTTNPDQTLYITKSGSKYHLKDCPHLTDTQRKTTRKEVEKTHEPCKTCKPDDE